jgi:hypothetical protein
MFLIVKPTEPEYLLLREQNEIHPMMCHPRGFLSSPCVHSSLIYFLPLISIGGSSRTSALGRRWDRSGDCSNSERSRHRLEKALREDEGDL